MITFTILSTVMALAWVVLSMLAWRAKKIILSAVYAGISNVWTVGLMLVLALDTYFSSKL